MATNEFGFIDIVKILFIGAFAVSFLAAWGAYAVVSFAHLMMWF